MHLTEEHYSEIERMAALFFSPADIAMNLEVDPEEFSILILAGDTLESKAYAKGRLTTDMQLRAAILQSALNGSSPSQQLMKDYQNRSMSNI